MLSVLLGNAMSLIWLDHGMSMSEPIASLIAKAFGGISKTTAIDLECSNGMGSCHN